MGRHLSPRTRCQLLTEHSMDVQYQVSQWCGRTGSYGAPIRRASCALGAPLIRQTSKVRRANVHDKYLEF